MNQPIEEELALRAFFRMQPDNEGEERAWRRLSESISQHQFAGEQVGAEHRPAWTAQGAAAIGLIILGVGLSVAFRLARTSTPAPVASAPGGSASTLPAPVAPATVSHRVGDVTLEERQTAETHPPVSQEEAAAVATRKLTQLNSSLTGYQVTSIYHAPALLRATDESGKQVSTFSPAIDAWVIQLGAPAQAEYTRIVGLVVIDARTGDVKTASLIAEGPGGSSSSSSSSSTYSTSGY
jgi:hypothetical protein